MTTTKEAIEHFFAERGDDLIDDYDIEEAMAEIGNPNANLPVTKTNETVDDFCASGWEWMTHCNEAVVLKRGGLLAHIADIGDHRLVWID